jgi:hypothetical protein
MNTGKFDAADLDVITLNLPVESLLKFPCVISLFLQGFPPKRKWLLGRCMLKSSQLPRVAFTSWKLAGSAYFRTRHGNAQEIDIVEDSISKN